ncbi:peptidoglycan-binding domain-containing protein [Paracoccus luteus]|uniref:peptidoglycan-binding domain-containing protein n=1 Tax=Paracoccus luteus TaxID=2508543 RepID=UPI00106F6C3C|nr:peptidoglycan-binding domain-containing protein [Paracoccus luteus]
MRAGLCAVIVLSTAAQAQTPAAERASAGFDTIFNVPGVQSIAIDPANGTLYAAASPRAESSGAVSDIVQWQLDPLRLVRTWPTDTLVSDLAVSPTGLVYAAGQHGAAPGGAGTKGGGAPRSGSLVSLDPGGSAQAPAVIVSYAGLEDVAAVSRFNQAAFDGEGRVYLAAPTQFSVAVFPDTRAPLQGATTMPRLVLQCGAPAQLSVFRSGGRIAYAASTTDGALLETGFVSIAADPEGTATASCFRVTNVFGYKEAPPTLNSLAHAVLADAAGRPDAVLALEPNTGILHLLRLDPLTQQLARADWIDLGTGAPGAITLLAASADGAVIFVGGQGQTDILRFRRDGDTLVRAGSLRSTGGLRQIEVSADGTYAAVVVRDPAGLDRIHLIRAPGALEDGAQVIPRSAETLRQVQSELNRLGYGVGAADGIPGPRTATALDRLGEQEGDTESGLFDLKSLIDGVLFTRPADERSY